MPDIAVFYIPKCKTLRIGAHLSMNRLAAESNVDRSIISKIEKHHPVTETSARKVFDALHKHHSNLSYQREVIKQSGA